MNCQNCGGPLEQTSSRGRMVCGYCHTVNQLEADARTLDRIVISEQFTDHSCPCCHQVLTRALIDDHAIEFCLKCQGFMTSRETFMKIVWQRRAEYTGAEEQPAPPHPQELKTRRNCPNCAMTMETHPYYGPGNAVIDSCAQCEVIWLDGGELTAIEKAPGQRAVPVIKHAPGCPDQFETYQTRRPRPTKVDPVKLLIDALFT